MSQEILARQEKRVKQDNKLVKPDKLEQVDNQVLKDKQVLEDKLVLEDKHIQEDRLVLEDKQVQLDNRAPQEKEVPRDNKPRQAIDIFCAVVDNYGDAGVCLHLARSLAKDGHQVRLFCDEMQVLNTIVDQEDHQLTNLSLLAWTKPLKNYRPYSIVINAFCCDFDEGVKAGLSQHPGYILLNLDYLSAEDWVESYHTTSAYMNGLEGFFICPGFTPYTAGLNIDKDFVARCITTLNQAGTLFWHQQRHQNPSELTPKLSLLPDQEQVVSLFSYQNPALEPIIQSLKNKTTPTHLKVFSGLALDNLNKIIHHQLKVGDTLKLRKSLTIEVLPMLQHHQYDEILLTSTLNIVRGEDSIVRAMHTGKPFLWQIYPQKESTHIVKLEAFLDYMSKVVLKIWDNWHQLLREYKSADLPLAIEQDTNDNVSLTDIKELLKQDPSPAASWLRQELLYLQQEIETLPHHNQAISAHDYPLPDRAPVTNKDEVGTNLHTFWPKLENFKQAPVEKRLQMIKATTLAYNQEQPYPENFSIESFMTLCSPIFRIWAAYLCTQENLSTRLIKFATEKQAERQAECPAKLQAKK